MGRTYKANRKKMRSFDINFAGANLLGYLHQAAGAGLYVPEKDSMLEHYREFPSTVFSMTKEEAIQCADALKKVDTNAVLDKMEETSCHLWNGTREEFHSWVREWIEWLEKSDGYEVE